MTKPKTTWTVEVLKDGKTEELVIELPVDLLNQMGWDVGDDLLWEEDTTAGVPTFKLMKKEQLTIYNICIIIVLLIINEAESNA